MRGSKMLRVQAYVERNPGCAMIDAADHVGPHNSLRFGYEIVHRAVRAGLVLKRERDDKRGCYRLYPAEGSEGS